MGLGRFGGGVGVTRFLVSRGAHVLVTDQDPADKLKKSVEMVRDLIDAGSVSLRLGEHAEEDFKTCDLVVANPAVKPGNVYLSAAESAGVEVTTEMRLLVQRLPNRQRTIGVTGSAGKSTTTAMIGHVLTKVFSAAPISATPISATPISATPFSAAPQGAGSPPRQPRVWVGGNIGGSLLQNLDQIGENDWVVLELSSFMLDRLRKDAHFPGWSPHIAVITNISPNHLDWHGSMEQYVRAKIGLFEYQSSPGAAYFGESVDPYIGYVEPVEGLSQPDYWFEEEFSVCMLSNPPYEGDFSQMCSLPGQHNRLNAMFAEAVCQRVLIDSSSMTDVRIDQLIAQIDDALMSFPGLPHRLQLVAEHNGVRYFNDSKCTTPEAAMLAIDAFIEDAGEKAPCIHLILGGYDKGSDFTQLASLAWEQCKAVYTIGKTGDTIAGLCEQSASRAVPDRPKTCGGVSWPAPCAEVVRCGDLDTAMDQIHKRIRPGDVVLLSPACASWGQFENYEHRGARFIELVNQQIGLC